MGACFTVNLELTFLDEAAAVKAMQEYIHTANADFGLEKHKKRSVGREIVRKYCFNPQPVLTETECRCFLPAVLTSWQ